MEPTTPNEQLEVIPIILPTTDVQTSDPMPDGSVIVRLHVVLPSNLFAGSSALLTANGSPVNLLQNAVVQQPAVQFICRADKISPEVVAQAKAAQAAEQAQAAHAIETAADPEGRDPYMTALLGKRGY